jgi:hypothetical protein
VRGGSGGQATDSFTEFTPAFVAEDTDNGKFRLIQLNGLQLF